MSEISFSKTDIMTAFNSFETISTNSDIQIKAIRENLAIIESNWSGPEHDSAQADKTAAETCLNEAEQIIKDINNSISKLNKNAQSVSYKN